MKLKTRFGKAKVALLSVLLVGVAGGIFYFARVHGGPGGSMSSQSNMEGRIIIIGMDGMSPKILEPLMKEGKVPNFAKLAAEGSYHHLQTTNPSQSPVAWTAFSTGQNAGQNGLFDFIKRNPKTYELSLSTSEVSEKPKPVVQSKRFWQYASDKGVHSAILSCPITFPPDQINGVMLSGMGVPDIQGTEGQYTFFTTESEPLNTDPNERENGGHTFYIDNNSEMKLDLLGPKKQVGIGKVENLKVPFEVKLDEDSASFQMQGQSFKLKPGEWSDWKDVSFSVGLFKKIKGIAKFYLISTSPEFKLYVTPINIDPRDPFLPICSPNGYGKELAEKIGLFHTQGMPSDTWGLSNGKLSDAAYLETLNDILNDKKHQLEYELNRNQSGILYAYFDTSDTIQHMFWRFRDPKNPLYVKDSPYSKAIEDWYIKMDGILGEVMSKLGPKDTLFVMSDHGFDSYRKSAHINSWLMQNGYLKLKDPSKKIATEFFENVDWSQTKAYALGFGAIYINEAEREGQGIVQPGAETDALKKEIITKMKGWTDPEDGSQVVHNVYPKEEIFHGDHADEAPDLYVGFNSGYRASWQTALGAAPATLIDVNDKKWSGDHLIDPSIVPGILFCNKKMNTDNPSILDLAPTVLKIVGYTVEEMKQFKLDGKPLL